MDNLDADEISYKSEYWSESSLIRVHVNQAHNSLHRALSLLQIIELGQPLVWYALEQATWRQSKSTQSSEKLKVISLQTTVQWNPLVSEWNGMSVIFPLSHVEKC